MKTYQVVVNLTGIRTYTINAQDEQEAIALLRADPRGPDVTLEEEEGPDELLDSAEVTELETD